MTTSMQEKFSNVRRKLDQLGYRQPLSLDSLPLTERLLSDLVWTTESLRKAKRELDKKFEVKGSVEEYIEPYKSDNAKLVRENNELHQKILEMRESQEKMTGELKSSLRVLESENDDLKFFNSQCLAKVQSLEKESKEKTDRINQLQEKNFQAVVHTPGGKKKNIPFRRQRMDIDSLVPAEPSETEKSSSKATPPVVNYDMVKVSDGRISELEFDIQRFKEQLEISERKIENFRKQVELRDAEIERLTRMMEGGRPYDVVSLEAKARADERLITQLKLQNDMLQDRNREMERRLFDAEDRLHIERKQELDLDTKNQVLSSELLEVDRLAHSLKAENEEALAAADRQLSQSKVELENRRRELMSLDTKIGFLEKERRKLEDSLSVTKKMVANSQGDNKELHELVERVTDDKRKLALRIEKLTANERALVLEIERLKRGKGSSPPGKKSRLSQVENYMKGIEQDRDYWRGEAELLSRLLRTNGTPNSRSASPKPGSRQGSRAVSPTRRSTTPSKAVKKDKINLLENTIRLLEDERDHYKREFEKLKTMNGSRSGSRSASPALSRGRSPTKSPPVRDTENDLEVMRLKRERDDLQHMLNKFERHVGEIQGNVRVLTQEKDSLSKLYEDTRLELNRVRNELVHSPKSPKVSLAAQAVLKRVETERDDAIADLRRMTTERDSLRERLRLSTETALNDKAKLEQRIEDLQTSARKAGSERDDYMTRANSLRQRVLDLEEQTKNVTRQLAERGSELQDEQTTSNQYRLQCESLQRQLETSERHGAQLDADLRESEDRVRILQDRLSALERELKAQRDDCARLRSQLSQVDQEKDGLQCNLDDKTERLAQMEVDLRSKEHSLSEARGTLTAAEQQLSRLQEVNTSRDREIKSFRKQADALSNDLSIERRRGDQMVRENGRLQDDLATLTRENQAIQGELQDTAEEREELRARVQEYVNEVKKAEELLGQKEQERGDLLEQYRLLSLEADRYQTQTHQLESETSNLRMEVMNKDSDLKRLQDQLEAAEIDSSEQKHTLQSYEIQVSSLTRCVAELEEQLRSHINEKEEVLRDLSALRDLCARLESGKDALQRQLTTRALDGEQMRAQLDDIEHEVNVLRDQLATEQENVKNLETILSTSREKEFQSQLDVQERGAELSMLRDRLALNETKVEQQQRELSRLRARNADLETEVERLHRSVTSEKYEKERALQELRRQGLGSGYRTSSSNLYSSPPPRVDGSGDY